MEFGPVHCTPSPSSDKAFFLMLACCALYALISLERLGVLHLRLRRGRPIPLSRPPLETLRRVAIVALGIGAAGTTAEILEAFGLLGNWMERQPADQLIREMIGGYLSFGAASFAVVIVVHEIWRRSWTRLAPYAPAEMDLRSPLGLLPT